MVLAMVLGPIKDLFWFFALLSVGEEAYKYTLYTTALDGTTYDLEADSTFESAAVGAIGFGAVGSLYVAIAKMGGSDDEEMEADYEEEVPATEPTDGEGTDEGN